MPRRAAPRTNLPVERGSFVGRLRLLDEIARHIDTGARLVSVVGPEGIGKTRLALRAAALELPRFGQRGGVWFIDARDVDSFAGIARGLLLVQGLVPLAAPDPEGDLSRALAGFAGPALVVLDGAERARAGIGATLAQAERESPETVFVVTAREPVGAAGERLVKVGPLKLAKQSAQDRKTLEAAEAVQLFVERASEALRGYRPNAIEVNAIARIVRQLDGVPLAIEIAAARLRALTAPELLERLPRKVGMLAGGDARKSTLAGAVAWSLELLPPWERAALAQAAVFRGGFDVDAASAVIDLGAFTDAPSVPVALESLLEKALLRVQDVPVARGDDVVDEIMRLDMPAVVREAAEARLDPALGREALHNRHAAYFLQVCGAWAEGVDVHGGLTLRRRLELESENLIAAVRRALTADPQTLQSIATALRGALALEPVLTMRGPHDLFLEILDRALEPADVVGVPYALRARAYEARARARRARQMLKESLQDLESALSCARRARDRGQEARALANIGTHHLLVGKHDLAAAEYTEALKLIRDSGDRKVEGRQLGFFGLLAHNRGDVDEAIKRYLEAIEVHREVGDRRWEGIHSGQLGAALLEAQKIDDARMCLRRALTIHRELQNRRHEAIVLSWLGDLHVEQGELDDARTSYERALAIHRQVGDPRGETIALARLGVLARRNKMSALEEEMLLRARALVDRLDDAELRGMLGILEGRSNTAGKSEAERAALRIARALTGR